MGQAFSEFFTTTIPKAAEDAWAAVVNGVTTLATWVGEKVESFVSSVIKGITDMADSVKNFFINTWNKVEEFAKVILGLSSNVKDYVYDKAYDVGEELRKAGAENARKRLRELSINIDGKSDDEVVKIWKEYMAKHPLKPEEKQEMDDAFSLKKKDEKVGANLYARAAPKLFTNKCLMDAPDFGGANFNAMFAPDSGFQFKSLEHSAVSQHLKDHAVTNLTFVFLYPEEDNTKPRNTVSLSPHEERELSLALTAY